jgi:hypothetical protein
MPASRPAIEMTHDLLPFDDLENLSILRFLAASISPAHR